MAAMFSSVTKPVIEGLNRFSGWILLFSILWLCWSIARIIWLVIAPPQAPNLPLMPIQTKQSAQVDASRALTIFDAPQAKQSQPPPNVILAGVMPSSISSLSSAMLSVNGEMANYRVGEQLAGTNYTLVDVSWDSIIIEDPRGRQSVVKMPDRMSLDQGQLPADTPNGMNNMGAGSLSLPPPNHLQPESSGQSAQPEVRNQQQGDAPNAATAVDDSLNNPLDNAISEMRQNPASYLSNVGVMATGDGYQVTAAMPEDLRQKFGVQPGDRVMSVNGQGVGSNPAADADLLERVKQSGQATIEVKRGDQTLTLHQNF